MWVHSMAQAQVSGNGDISTANSQVIIDADLKGGDLVAIGAVSNAVAFHVMFNPRISSVADLKGQKIGVERSHCCAHVLLDGFYMHTNKKGFKTIIARYSKITDPGMLDGSVEYAYDFVEKVSLMKQQAFQVTVEQIAEKRPEKAGQT